MIAAVPPVPGRTWIRAAVLAAILLLVTTVLAAVALGTGASGVSFGAAFDALRGRGGAADRQIVLNLRLPRVLCGIAVGSMLAVAGGLLQAATRNRLAEPATLGISPAAGAAVAIAYAGGHDGAGVGTSVAALGGALAGAATVAALAARFGHDAATMLVVGIAAATTFTAVTTLLMVVSGAGAQRMLLWLTGTLSRAEAGDAGFALAAAAVLLLAVWPLTGLCDLLVLDDETSAGLGVGTGPARLAVGAAAAGLTAAAVTVVGVLGFVALLCPHAARALTRTSAHAVVLPVAALLGSCLVLAADLAGRTLLAPLELPVGVVLGIIGAPLLIVLVRRRHDGGGSMLWTRR